MNKPIVLVKVPKDGFDSNLRFKKELKYFRAVNFKELAVLIDFYEDQIKEIVVEEVQAFELKDFDMLREKATKLKLKLITPEESLSASTREFENTFAPAGITVPDVEEEKKEYRDSVDEPVKASEKAIEKSVDTFSKEEHQSVLAKFQSKVEKRYKDKEIELQNELNDLKDKLNRLRKEKADIEEQQISLLELSSAIEQEKREALVELEQLKKESERFKEKEERLNSELREALLQQEDLLGSKANLEETLEEKNIKFAELEKKSVKLLEVVQVLKKKEKDSDVKLSNIKSNFEQKLSILESSLSERESEYEKLYNEFIELQEKSKEANEQRRNFESLFKELSIKNRKAEEEISALSKEIDRLQELEAQHLLMIQEQSLYDNENNNDDKEESADTEIYKQNIAELEKKLQQALLDKREAEDLMKRLKETSDEIEIELNKELHSTKEELKDIRESKEKLNSQNRELEAKIKELQEKQLAIQSTRDISNDALGEEIESLRNELDKTQDVLLKKQESLDTLTEKLNKANELYNKQSIKIEELEAEVAIQQENFNNLKEQSDKKLKEVKESSGLSVEASSAQMKEILGLKEKMLVLKKEMNEKDKAYEDLQDDLRVSLKKRESAIQEINELYEREKRVGQAYAKLKKEYDKLRAEVKDKSSNLAVDGHTIWREEMAYIGRAKIITFSGSGSRGVTQLLMAVSRKLPKRSKICLIDLNANNPRLGSVIKKEPFIDIASDLKEYIKRTSMGAFLNKGENYFFENVSRTILKLGETKDGLEMHYLSGAYVNFTYEKMASLNFQSFMNRLGDMFDYILIDIGTIDKTKGMSGELLKRLWQIAHRNVLITLKDTEDVRNTRLMLNDLRIKEFKNCLWVLNFAMDSRVDEVIRKSVADAKVIILPLDNSIQNYNSNLFQSKSLKNNINEIASYCQN